MQFAIKHGKQNTAMMAFSSLLSDEAIADVVYFVRTAFMRLKLKNTRYHTVENGWLNHDQYRIAYPFALGQIAIDSSDDELTEAQRKGKQLYLTACVSCHDRGKVNEEGVDWESRSLSWPRNNYSNKITEMADSISQASPFALHDIKNVYVPGSKPEKIGQQIYQNNCAFCHAPDGSGKNWVGRFIEPHPKNFLKNPIRQIYDKQELRKIISEGKKNSAMPAWKYVLSKQEIEYVISYMWHRFK